jgi:superoxide reductase
MAKVAQVYKCEACGNIVMVYHEGGGELVCCGAPMKHMEEKTADFATEKHVPVVEAIEGGYKVYVGSTEHPMTDDHYIEWIELFDGETVFTKYLKPGDKPEAIFKTDKKAVSAREYCNIHGHWSNNL